MKLNADIGEYSSAHQIDSDVDIMPFIDQANIACGGHAGDPISMDMTVKLASSCGVEIGAHPSYPDVTNFGRRSMQIPLTELRPIIHAQIGALDAIASAQGATLSYIKPHGALYNDMIQIPAVFDDVIDIIAAYPRSLKLMIQATEMSYAHQQKADKHSVDLILEAFADRAYQANGMLVSRHHDGAVLDLEDALDQAASIIHQGFVTCIDGKKLALRADTLCVHGDTQGALNMVKLIRKMLGSD